MDTYDIGDVVNIKGAFNSPAGSPLDPGGVVVHVKSPNGTKTVYTYGVDVEVLKDSTGRYRVALEPTIKGVWWYRFEGVTSNKGAGESSFFIRNSAFD